MSNVENERMNPRQALFNNNMSVSNNSNRERMNPRQALFNNNMSMSNDNNRDENNNQQFRYIIMPFQPEYAIPIPNIRINENHTPSPQGTPEMPPELKRNNKTSQKKNIKEIIEETSISFEEYLKEHNKKVKSNIEELNDFNKEKLINKILQNVDNQERENLETQSFGDLWHLLINDRVNKYSKSFSDSDYEIYMNKIFRESALYKNKNRYSYRNNNLYSNNNYNNPLDSQMNNSQNYSQQILDQLKVSPIVFSNVSMADNIFNINTLIQVLKNNNYNTEIIQTNKNIVDENDKEIFKILGINEEKIEEIYGTKNVDASQFMTDWLEIIMELFTIHSTNYILNIEVFIESIHKWFTTILFLYYFKSIEETSNTRLHESILDSDIFTLELSDTIEYYQNFYLNWDFLSTFVVKIIIPYYQDIFNVNILNEIKNFIETEDDGNLLNKFLDPSNPEYVWEREPGNVYVINSYFLKQEISNKFNEKLINIFDTLPLFIICHKILNEIPLPIPERINNSNMLSVPQQQENIINNPSRNPRDLVVYNNLNGGGSLNSNLSEITDLPADLKLTIETERNMENLISVFKSCDLYGIPGTNINKNYTFEKFKEFLSENVELVDEVNFLRELDNESVMDIYRIDPYYQNSEIEQDKGITPFDQTESIIIFFVRHEGNVKVIGLFMDPYNDSKKYHVMFSTNRDNVDTRSFPLLLDVNQDFASETENRFHNSYTLEIKNLNPQSNNINEIDYNDPNFMNNHPWQSPIFSNESMNNTDVEDSENRLLTDTTSSKPLFQYIIYLQFDDRNAPREYLFASYDFEKSYYLNFDSQAKNEKTQILDFINTLLMKMYVGSTNTSIVINTLYLQRPNIETIEKLENNEYVIVVYKNIDNFYTYCSLLQFKESSQTLEKVFQYEVQHSDIRKILDLKLNYNGSNEKLFETKIKINISDYSLFSSINYKKHKLNNLNFINTPSIEPRNEEYASSTRYDRRNFKLLRFNNTFEDIKSKRDYFYMKQYFERLFNVSNLDDKEVLEVFKKLVNDDKSIINKFRDIPTTAVEYFGYDNSGNKDTGIDDGGIRPSFFENLGNEICNTFLSNLYRKSNELDIEGQITEYKNMGQKYPTKYDKLTQCVYLDETECRRSQESDRKDDCFFNEKSKKCDNVNHDVPLFITKNSEKYNSFCRYNIPVEDSYKLGGALMTKMLLLDNGLVLKDFYKVPRISTPRFNLSFYLINRFMNNHYLDWVDIFACLKLDNKEKYLQIVGDKCNLLDDKKIVYRLKEKLDEVDVSELKKFSISSYSCTKYADNLGGEDDCDGGFEMKIKSQYFLSQLYLSILEYYESDCLKEYFYFVKGMNLVVTKNEIEKYIETPINQGFIYKLFFGKQPTLNELLDVEYSGSRDDVLRVKNNYSTYVHNLFNIDESQISFELFDDNSNPLNIVNGKNMIELFLETNKELYDKMINDYVETISMYRIKENLNKPFLYEKDTKTYKEPILVVSNVTDPDNPKRLTRMSVLKINQDVKLFNVILTEEDSFKYNSILVGGKYEKKSIGYALPNLKYNNSQEQEDKIKKLLQFWTSQKVIPNTPKLAINVTMDITRFPSAHTCYNQLDIPAYDLYEIFESRLDQALNSMERNEAYVEEGFSGGGNKGKRKYKKSRKTRKSRNKLKNKKNSLKRKKYYIKRK